jgi:hypothetical protein
MLLAGKLPSGRTEMPMAGGLADEQNKGLRVVSVAEKRCYWLASRPSGRAEMPLAGGLTVEILLASVPTSGREQRRRWLVSKLAIVIGRRV